MAIKIDYLKKKIMSAPRNSGGKRQFSQELRDEVVLLINSSEHSLTSICRELEISVGTVHSWLKTKAPSPIAASNFETIPIVDTPDARNVASESLELVSPDGFRIIGSCESIMSIWRDIHATSSRL